MQANRSFLAIFEPQSDGSLKASWAKAYLRFLVSRDESAALKVAPLALVGVLPADILTNLIPVIGELDDVWFTIAIVIIAVRTIQRVRQYR
jgi:uncharacterized membrane protein YkvA (DUF1232 family)